MIEESQRQLRLTGDTSSEVLTSSNPKQESFPVFFNDVVLTISLGVEESWTIPGIKKPKTHSPALFSMEEDGRL
jgi:hypothetical protein